METTERFAFLKLGGSLITDKDRPSTPRLDVIDRVCAEMARARAADPALRLLVGHGSGSVGHAAARNAGFGEGPWKRESWQQFADVWIAARALNQIIVERMAAAGLPVIAFPPSAILLSDGGAPAIAEVEPIRHALDANLVPLVNGDVVFDYEYGGAIVSTEAVFQQLAIELEPNVLLLCGIEDGVYADFPSRSRLIGEITPGSVESVRSSLLGSTSPDVTGGMMKKVEHTLSVCRQNAGLEAFIFSGLRPGNVERALLGTPQGTRIAAQ